MILEDEASVGCDGIKFYCIVHITARARLDPYVRHVVVSHPLANFIIQMSLFDVLLIVAPSDLLVLQSTVVPLEIWD